MTEKALEKAREHFQCADLNGVEIENEPGSGTEGSHWEQRVFFNEFMTGTTKHHPIVSAITLGYMEDTGWYKVNYSKAEYLAWGNKKGCSFAMDKCIRNRDAPEPLDPRHFCTSPPYPYSEEYEYRCYIDRTAAGVCLTVKHEKPIPEHFQYFNDPTWGGYAIMDYCPVYDTYTSIGATSDCRFENNKLHDSFGEKYGENSRCFESSLVKVKLNLEPTLQGRCYPTKCFGNSTLQILVGDIWVTCSKPGEHKTNIHGFKGHIVCPEFEIICQAIQDEPKIIKCKNDCSGTGSCNLLTGKCDCVKGYTGEDCSLIAGSGEISVSILVMIIIVFVLI